LIVIDVLFPWCKTPINITCNRSNFTRKALNTSRQGRSSCALIHHRLAGLEPKRRTRTLQQSPSTKFGGRRIVSATPRHHQSPAKPCHRRCLSSLPTARLRDLTGKIRHHLLIFLPLVLSRTMHRSDSPASPESRRCLLCGLPPPLAEDVMSHPSLDQ
jgi:hypothetical protein